MHSRDRNGWGGILGSDDLIEDSERTDPNLETPSFDDDLSEEKTTIAHHPMLQKSKLTLPRPQSEPGEGGERSPPPVEFAVEVDQIVQKLEPPRKREAKKKEREDRLFTKEVILTIIGGVLLLGGAVAYSRYQEETPLVVSTPPELAPKLQVQKPPPAIPEPKNEAAFVEEAKAEEPRKATTPILSILSNPSGATVEIDGTIYGKTPLIQPGPPNVKSLAIRLLKDNYKKFETLLTPNEAGHFNLNATLEKR